MPITLKILGPDVILAQQLQQMCWIIDSARCFFQLCPLRQNFDAYPFAMRCIDYCNCLIEEAQKEMDKLQHVVKATACTANIDEEIQSESTRNLQSTQFKFCVDIIKYSQEIFGGHIETGSNNWKIWSFAFVNSCRHFRRRASRTVPTRRCGTCCLPSLMTAASSPCLQTIQGSSFSKHKKRLT